MMSRRARALQNIEDRIYRLTVGGPPDSRWRRLINVFTEQGYATVAIRRRFGLSTPLATEDRRILEESIFPYYCGDSRFNRILFVGCAVFTSHYQEKFFAGRNSGRSSPALIRHNLVLRITSPHPSRIQRNILPPAIST